MNAVPPPAVPRRILAGSWSDTIAMLRACAPLPLLRWLCLGAVVLLLTGTTLATVSMPRTGPGANIALTLAACAVALPWSLWCSRLLLLRMEAHAWRMPALSAAIPSAFAHLLLATVALPAVLLVAVAGTDPVSAFSGLLFAAMAGLFAAMLPLWCYLALCFAPLTLAMFGLLAARLWGPELLKPGLASLFAIWQLPWLAMLAILVAAWRWRAIIGTQDIFNASPWRQPAVLGVSGGVWFGSAATPDANRWQANMPDWLWPAGQVNRAGSRQQPLHAMRAILGTPFAPLRRSQVAVQLGFTVLAFGTLALGADSSTDAQWLHSMLNGGLSGGLAGGGMVLVWMYGWRLDVLRRRPSGELAELALLPGWGNASQARRTLLSAAARPLLRAAALAAVILLALAIAIGLSAFATAWLLVSIVGLVLLAALACLRPLSGQRMVTVWMVGLYALMVVTLVATTLGATRPENSTLLTGWLAAGWLVLYLACGLGLAQAWRRYRARPHPFVQD